MRFEFKVRHEIFPLKKLINIFVSFCFFRLYVINSRLYGRPKLDPARPHRTLTKQLLEDIFNDK